MVYVVLPYDKKSKILFLILIDMGFSLMFSSIKDCNITSYCQTSKCFLIKCCLKMPCYHDVELDIIPCYRSAYQQQQRFILNILNNEN